MALELNGTTGVSLVQDGVVQTADIADDAVTLAKIADYQTGVHTVTVSFLGGGSASFYANQDSLNYVKIGNLVHVNGRLRFETLSSPSGQAKFTLPFSVDGSADQNEAYGSCALYLVDAPASTYNAVVEAEPGGSAFNILFQRDNDTWIRLDNSVIAANDYIGVTLTYFTNE